MIPPEQSEGFLASILIGAALSIGIAAVLLLRRIVREVDEDV